MAADLRPTERRAPATRRSRGRRHRGPTAPRTALPPRRQRAGPTAKLTPRMARRAATTLTPRRPEATPTRARSGTTPEEGTDEAYGDAPLLPLVRVRCLVHV